MTKLTDLISLLHNEEPIKEPLFLKSGSDAEKQLADLRALYAQARAAGASKELLTKIERDGKLIDYGIAGEESLAFELRNSHLPLIVIHDLYLEFEGLSAQIDYFIVTRKMALVLECKNLYGDISLDDKGGFTRGMHYAGQYRKEGIYSPVTQLQRHMDLVRQIGAADKGAIGKAAFQHYFEDNYRSFVVLANPKTVLRDKNAPEEVRDKVIRADALIETIKRLNEESKNSVMTDREMRAWGERWLSRASECPTDYLAKYREALAGLDGVGER